jgi:hypothetical protein
LLPVIGERVQRRIAREGLLIDRLQNPSIKGPAEPAICARFGGVAAGIY